MPQCSVAGSLFVAQIDICDAKRVGELIADDFEFYLDRWDKIATSRTAYVAFFRTNCERPATGVDYLTRRELDGSSHEDEALATYRTVDLGAHRFFEPVARLPGSRAAGQPEELTEIARFDFVRAWMGDTRRRSRVISYTHQKIAGH